MWSVLTVKIVNKKIFTNEAIWSKQNLSQFVKIVLPTDVLIALTPRALRSLECSGLVLQLNVTYGLPLKRKLKKRKKNKIWLTKVDEWIEYYACEYTLMNTFSMQRQDTPLRLVLYEKSCTWKIMYLESSATGSLCFLQQVCICASMYIMTHNNYAFPWK